MFYLLWWWLYSTMKIVAIYPSKEEHCDETKKQANR